MAKDKIICDTDVMIDYWDKTKPRHAATKSISKGVYVVKLFSFLRSIWKFIQ